MPLGLYRVRPAEIRSGSRVLVCLPESIARVGRERDYLPRGPCPSGASAVLKIVAALSGDRVELHIDSLVVNGVATAARRLRDRDGRGRSLPHAPLGVSWVPDRTVWLLGLRPDRSWDSRYFGPVPLASILGSADPILTWGDDSADTLQSSVTLPVTEGTTYYIVVAGFLDSEGSFTLSIDTP